MSFIEDEQARLRELNRLRDAKQNLIDMVCMKHAYVEASRSHCARKGVGAIAATPDGRILCTGYNGTAAGEENCVDHFARLRGDSEMPGREEHRDWSDRHEIHAEMNLIIFAARHGIALMGCTLYCTLQPCWQCLKALGQLGIARLVHDQLHSRNADTDLEWLDYCRRRSIRVTCLRARTATGTPEAPSYVSSEHMVDGQLVQQVEQGTPPTPFEPAPTGVQRGPGWSWRYTYQD